MIRKAEKNDIKALASLANIMWTNHTEDELAEDFAEIISQDSSVVLLKTVNDAPVGFAQCTLRNDYVEGTHTSPVGYLEGIFIEEKHRKKGYAKELLKECENWARKKGCTEFASDCELDNKNSLAFHKALKFTEANRIICFTKKL